MVEKVLNVDSEVYQVDFLDGSLQLRDASGKYQIDLKNRLLDFAINTLRFLATLKDRKEFEVIKYQLSKSATSIGANYEESQTSTFNEFLHKIRVALREANESSYWLKILEALDIADQDQVKTLLRESQEIGKILGAIASKTDKIRKQQNEK